MQAPQQYGGMATVQAMPQQEQPQYGYADYNGNQYTQTAVGYSDTVPAQFYGGQYQQQMPAPQPQVPQAQYTNGTNGYAQAVQPPPVQPFPAKQQPYTPQPAPQPRPQPQYQPQPAPQNVAQRPAGSKGRLVKPGRYWPSKFFPLITKQKPVYEADLPGYNGRSQASPAPAPGPAPAPQAQARAPAPALGAAPPVQPMPPQNYGQAPPPPPITGGYFEEGSSGEAL